MGKMTREEGLEMVEMDIDGLIDIEELDERAPFLRDLIIRKAYCGDKEVRYMDDVSNVKASEISERGHYWLARLEERIADVISGKAKKEWDEWEKDNHRVEIRAAAKEYQV